MNRRIFTVFLLMTMNFSALIGCNQVMAKTPEATLTKEEASEIALQHAGYTTDEVTFLRTEYEIDDGIPQYEISFRQDGFEYDYTIHAKTGAILSYDKET